uniref:Uncharacterized protein n=1 Tax=Quercus lobata TaxID=97700 RepID=A0A7N2MFL9_QUELO
MEKTNVSLRLLINTESQRVHFAEAEKNFIDFLFHILSLPVGTFITILTKQGMVGSLGNIYESIENINITCLQPNLNKETLLKSRVHISGGGTGVTLLLPKVKSPSTSRYWYRCSRKYSCYSYGVKLLKASLQSKTVLTDVLLPLLKPEGKLESERQTTMGGNGADAVAAPAGGGAPAAVVANLKNEENVEDTGVWRLRGFLLRPSWPESIRKSTIKRNCIFFSL